jgi:hypothetical protein
MAKPSLRDALETYTTDFVKADYDRAFFHADPMIDSLFTALTALSANVWTVQRRLSIMEILLDKHGSVTREMIEKYVPSKDEAAALKEQRDEFVAEIYDPFRESGDVAYGTSLHPPALSQSRGEKGDDHE